MEAAFVAPEVADFGTPDDIAGFDHKPSWDVAVRFQDLKRYGHIPEKEKRKLKKRAIEGILERAKAVLGSVVHPEKNATVDYSDFQILGERGELDLLATLDEGFHVQEKNIADKLRFTVRIPKESYVAVVMDASLSMTGEKIALLAVATAVVALSVPSERVSFMGFDSRIKWIKKFKESLTPEQVIERVLDLPAGGFTNLEQALEESSKMLAHAKRTHANVILISDGKYTEGKDPTYLAPRFQHLHVLKLGRDQAGRELLQELVHLGHGKFFEARKTHDLPKTMYGAIRALLR